MKKIVVAGIALLVVVIGAGLIWQTQHRPAPVADNSAGEKSEPAAPNKPQTPEPKKRPAEEAPKAKPEKSAEDPVLAYCRRAASDKADASATAALAKQGGLVAILNKESALKGDPYACGDYYLAHGGDIDAKDPRESSEHLTPLLFAIQRNDPKMLACIIDHGADLKKRGGPEDVKPYGYAVFLALKNRATNYNRVIADLDAALKKAPAAKTKDNG